MAFLLTNSQSHVIPHQHSTNDIIGLIELIENNAVVVSASAPANPSAGKLWYNTTKGVFNIYNGSSWILVGPEVTPITKAQYDALSSADKNDGRFYLITDNDGTILVEWDNVLNKPLYIQTTAPSSPTDGYLWYDTTNHILKVYNTNAWTPVDTDTTYSAGDGIDIDANNNNAISVDVTDIIGTGLSEDANNNIIVDTTVVATQTDLTNGLSTKQDTINDLNTIRSGAAAGATAVQPLDNVSSLTNDAGYITNAVNDLTNYYTKTQTYTKTEVDNLLSNFGGFEVVEQLPAVATANPHIIYLLGPIGTGGDKYEEWIVTQSCTGAFESEDEITRVAIQLDENNSIYDYGSYTDGIYVGFNNLINNGVGELDFVDWIDSNTSYDLLNETMPYIFGECNYPQVYIGDSEIASGATCSIDMYYSDSPLTWNPSAVCVNQWTKIGDTSVDLSNYFNTFTDTADSINAGTNHLFVSPSEKSTWNAKQDALIAGDNITISSNTISANVNTKTFPMAVATKVADAQAAIDWVLDGNDALINLDNRIYLLDKVENGVYYFKAVAYSNNGTNDTMTVTNIEVTVVSDTVTEVHIMGEAHGYLETNRNYVTPFVPTQNGHPATKKYVDDSLNAKISAGTTSPSNPAEGQLWYDTTNDVLKVYDGTDWNTVDVNTTYTAGFGINIDTVNNNEISVDTTDLDGFGLSSNGGTGVLDVDLDALDGFGLSVNGGTGLLDVDIDSLIDTTNGHLDIDPSTSKVSVDMSDLTYDLAGFGLSQDVSGSSYKLKVDTYSIAGEYLSQNASDSKLDVDTTTLTSDLAGFGLGTDYNSSTGKYSLKVDVDDIDGFGLTTDSSGANTVLKVDTYDLAGSYLSQNVSNSKLDVDLTSLLTDIAGFGLDVDSSGANYKLKVDNLDLIGTGLQDNHSGGISIYPMGFVDTSKYLTVDNQDKVGVDIDSLGLALAGSYSGLDYDSSNHNLYVDPTDFIDTSTGYLDVDHNGMVSVDKTDLGLALAGNGLDYNTISNDMEVRPMDFIDTSTGYLDINNGIVSVDKADLGLALAGTGLDYNSGTGAIDIDTMVVATQTDLTGKQDKATSGSGAPSTTPTYIGQVYIDTTNNNMYVATGTTSSSDWTAVDTNTTYTAGDGIDIINDEISVDVTDIIGTGLSEDANNNIIIDTTVVATQTDLSNISQFSPESSGTTGYVLKKTSTGYDWEQEGNDETAHWFSLSFSGTSAYYSNANITANSIVVGYNFEESPVGHITFSVEAGKLKVESTATESSLPIKLLIENNPGSFTALTADV